MSQAGLSINPLQSEEAFWEWVNLASGVVGTAAGASASRVAGAVARGSATQRMMQVDTFLRTTSTSIDGFATIDAGAATLQNWNDLSAEERALAIGGGSLFVAATLSGGGGRASRPDPRSGSYEGLTPVEGWVSDAAISLPLSGTVNHSRHGLI